MELPKKPELNLPKKPDQTCLATLESLFIIVNIVIYLCSMMILPQLRMSYKPLKICAGDFADRKKTVENKEFYMIKEGRVLDALYFFFGTFFIIFVIAFVESIWPKGW